MLARTTREKGAHGAAHSLTRDFHVPIGDRDYNYFTSARLSRTPTWLMTRAPPVGRDDLSFYKKINKLEYKCYIIKYLCC